MDTISELHFVKLPNKYRNDHFQNWLSIAVFRLLMVLDSKPVHSAIEELKKSGLVSTRVRLSRECESQFYQLSAKHDLTKLDTFLFVCHHIETHPAIYFEKTKTVA
ncbi:hypothetical protein VIOR103205_09015 [Vibrio ordalii]